MRSSIIAMLTLALAACASSEPPTAVSATDPNAPVCHREVPTGSNVWHTVCASPQDSDTREATRVERDAGRAAAQSRDQEGRDAVQSIAGAPGGAAAPSRN